MLILGRSVGEQVVIGEGEDQIIVTVVVARDGHVRLGFDAPQWIPVHRSEVYERIQKENAERAVAS